MSSNRDLTFAGNIAGFLAHTIQLLNSSTEVTDTEDLVHRGNAGNAAETLQSVAKSLEAHRDLFDTDLTIESRPREEWPDLWALNDVASTCREDYDKLLNTLEEIGRIKPQSTQWPSFRHALQERLYTNEIEELDARCTSSWVTLSHHFCSLTRCLTRRYQQKSSELREVNVRHVGDVPEHFRQQVGLSPDLEAMPRHLAEMLERLELVEGSNRVSVEDVEYCRHRFHALDLATFNVRREQMLINSLTYEGHDVQVRSIPSLGGSVFSWVFSTCHQQTHTPTFDLGRWLRQGDGVALVVGESGTGKSMLMKYMSAHRDLASILYQWSNPVKVIIASHYFCGVGTAMQSSHRGFLQSLLRALLLQLPEHVEAVRRDCGITTSPELLRDYAWDETQLEGQLVKTIASHMNTKFCLFVDALDQYKGDLPALVTFLQSLMRLGNVKLCASSSSIGTLRESFTVRLLEIPIGGQVLRQDVRLDLAERLRHHPLFLRAQEPATSRITLASKIAERTQNFFLGRVTVEQLRLHYRTGQSLQDVLRSLDEIPSQLEALVKHCLRATPANMVQLGAYTFLVARGAKSPPPMTIYHYLSREQYDPDYALKLPPRALAAQQTAENLQAARNILDKACGCFLQVRPDLRVGFTHGLVRDIFDSSDLISALRSKAAPRYSNVQLSLARAYLAYMKTTKLSWGRPVSSRNFLRIPSLSRIFGEFLDIARELDGSSKMYQLLDDWQACFSDKCQLDQLQLSEADRVRAKADQHFSRPVLDALLVGYIDHKLTKQPLFLGYPKNQSKEYEPPAETPALSLVLRSMFDSDRRPVPRTGHIRMLQCLLQHGHDPNYTYSDCGPTLTPWTELIGLAVSSSEIAWAVHSGIFSLFLKHGAEPNSGVCNSQPAIFEPARRYTSSWVRIVYFISDLLRGEAATLCEGDERAILSLLDELCAAGASAQVHPCHNFFDSPEPCTDIEWAMALVKHLLDPASIAAQGNITFRAAIVERVILVLRQSRFGVEGCWPILREALTPAALQRIQEKPVPGIKGMENGASNTTSTAKPGKRTSDESTPETEVSSKRSRSEAEDETMTTTMAMRMEMGNK